MNLSWDSSINNQRKILMVSFSEGVINEIKCATTETELKSVVENSFLLLKERKIFNETAYIINMIVSLRSTKKETLDPVVINNIKTAIEFFREHKIKNRERLF
jgi:hypothetical protein